MLHCIVLYVWMYIYIYVFIYVYIYIYYIIWMDGRTDGWTDVYTNSARVRLGHLAAAAGRSGSPRGAPRGARRPSGAARTRRGKGSGASSPAHSTGSTKPQSNSSVHEMAVAQTLVPKLGCPRKWNQGLKPAVPWWFNFDPYPDGEVGGRILSREFDLAR